MVSFVIHVDAQEVYYQVNAKSKKFSHQAQRALVQFLDHQEGFERLNYAPVVIKPILTKGSTKRIEGMESKNIGEHKLILKISNKVSGKKSTLKFSDVIAHTGRESDAKLVKALLEKNRRQIIEGFSSIQEDITCDQYAAYINKVKSGDVDTNAAQLWAYLSYTEICEEELSADISGLKEFITNHYCEEALYKAEVMIASGTVNDLKNAGRILMSLPPSDQCRAKAQKLVSKLDQKSKEIGAQEYIIHRSYDQHNYDSWIKYILTEE